MTDKEKIIAEIERLNNKNETYPDNDRDLVSSCLYRGRKQICQMLLDFIKSLPIESQD